MWLHDLLSMLLHYAVFMHPEGQCVVTWRVLVDPSEVEGWKERCHSHLRVQGYREYKFNIGPYGMKLLWVLGDISDR